MRQCLNICMGKCKTAKQQNVKCKNALVLECSNAYVWEMPLACTFLSRKKGNKKKHSIFLKLKYENIYS